MKLLFPGSFDPFTIGHADLVERALKLGAEVVIAIGINEEKKPLFSTAQRLDAIREYYNGNPAVSVIEYKGLTVDAVRDKVYADSGVLLEPEIKFVGERG